MTGITLPITKHNYLVTRAEDIARSHARGVLHRPQRAARPGAGRHRQRCAAGTASSWEYDAAPIKLRGYRPDLRPLPEAYRERASR